MITAANFRDFYLSSLVIGYDWERSEHFAQITVRSSKGEEHSYKIHGLTAWSAFEDFAAQYIEQCTLLEHSEGIYLCLDPFYEGERSDKDNFWFFGAGIVESIANNLFKPTPKSGAA